MQHAAFEQHLEHVVDTAHRMQVLGEEAPAGFHVGDQRCLLRNPREIIERELDAGLMGNRRDMQSGIGGASSGRHCSTGVLQALLRDEVTRQRASRAQQLHHHAARLARGRGALLRHRGHRGRPRQRKAERLGHHRHRVGGELARARAQRRQADALEPVELGLLHVAGHHGAHGLEGIEDGDVLAFPASGRGRPAVHEDGGQVQAHHGHHHARQRLVASGKGHQCVVSVPSADGLHAIGDDFARSQRELHPCMAHRHRIGHSNRGKIKRRAAPLLDGHARFAREFA